MQYVGLGNWRSARRLRVHDVRRQRIEPSVREIAATVVKVATTGTALECSMWLGLHSGLYGP